MQRHKLTNKPHVCKHWIHIKCNNVSYLDYRYLQNCNKFWHYIECYSRIFPFKSLSCDVNFLTCRTNAGSSNMLLKELKNAESSSLSLKATPNFELLVNPVNNAPQKIIASMKIFLYQNIMILTKCIKFKYLTKSSIFRCSV